MRKRWVLLTSMLLLGSAGTAEAAPLDSPDIVYIDGLPCNRLCQSYMAWSRKASSISAQAAFAPRFPKPRGATGMRGEGSRSATRVRLAKPAAPNSNGMRQAPIADSQPARNAGAVSNSGTQERVTTAAPAPEQKAGHSDHAEVVLPGVAEKPASASSNNGDHLVAILVARPEIKSVSDLTNKNIAIDDRQAASDAHLGTAIAAAGAGEVQLSEGQTKAINRLISGEVSAAVLTSIYPEAADWVPEIAGFTIFRIPLSPSPVKARLESAGDGAPGAGTESRSCVAKQHGPAGCSSDGAPGHQVGVRSGQQEHCDRCQAICVQRDCPDGDRGGGSNRSPADRGSNGGCRSVDQWRGAGRGSGPRVSAGGGLVSRNRGLQDSARPALAACIAGTAGARGPGCRQRCCRSRCQKDTAAGDGRHGGRRARDDAAGCPEDHTRVAQQR